jgi:hypothetical protein
MYPKVRSLESAVYEKTRACKIFRAITAIVAERNLAICRNSASPTRSTRTIAKVIERESLLGWRCWCRLLCLLTYSLPRCGGKSQLRADGVHVLYPVHAGTVRIASECGSQASPGKRHHCIGRFSVGDVITYSFQNRCSNRDSGAGGRSPLPTGLRGAAGCLRGAGIIT